MVTTLFFDKIVRATELRARQKKWLDTALTEPVTITYSSGDLAILNRDRLRNLFMHKYFSELALRICGEAMTGEKSRTLAWIEDLNTEEKKQFHTEFITSVLKAVMNDDWAELEILLDDWKATAEAKQDVEFMEELQEKTSRDEYVLLK